MKVLLSIKPEYSEKIFSGEKKYEFRKRRPKSAIDIVFVYESSPKRNIVGGFSVKKIHSGTPEEIWEKCKDSSGIDRSNYLNYCNGTDIIHAFEIDETFKFEKPMNPFETISDFKPPQSFSYLGCSMLSEIIENCKIMLQNQSSNRNFCDEEGEITKSLNLQGPYQTSLDSSRCMISKFLSK